ncbi:MAG TPA: diacylglycerol kinase family protein, partial [Polyangiaceae bacterium]
MTEPRRATVPRVRVILNPSAAAGAALHKVGAIGEALRRFELPHEIVLTRARGHAKELARAAAADEVDVIAVVGGDGTLNEVAQAYLGESGEALGGPDLALIPCGTGGDFKRTLGMSGALEEAVARIRHGQRRAIDLGVLRMVGNAGEEKVYAFVNIASFGIGGLADSIVNESPKWMGTKPAFILGILRAMAAYKNASVRVKVDGKPWYEGPAFNIAVANGRFFGGGMMMAPHADPSDGRLEVVALGDLSRAEVVALSTKIYQGAHLGARGIKVTSGTRVEAEALHPWANVLMDV